MKITARIPHCQTEHGSGLGTVRSVIERTLAWHHSMRRLRIRYERRDDIHEAFLGLATCSTPGCWNSVGLRLNGLRTSATRTR